jgi:hypothetical protein
MGFKSKQENMQDASKLLELGDERTRNVLGHIHLKESRNVVTGETRRRSKVHWREAEARLAVMSKAVRAAEEMQTLQKATAVQASRMLNIVWAIESHVLAMEDDDFAVKSIDFVQTSPTMAHSEVPGSLGVDHLMSLPRPQALLSHLQLSMSVAPAAEAQHESYVKAKARLLKHRRSMSFLFEELHQVVEASSCLDASVIAARISNGNLSPSKPRALSANKRHNSVSYTVTVFYHQSPHPCFTFLKIVDVFHEG